MTKISTCPHKYSMFVVVHGGSNDNENDFSEQTAKILKIAGGR